MTDENTTEQDENEEKTQELYLQLNGHMAMCNGMNMLDILRLTSAMNIDVVLQTAQRQSTESAKKVIAAYKEYHRLTLERMESLVAKVEDEQTGEGEELDLSDIEVFDPPRGVQ